MIASLRSRLLTPRGIAWLGGLFIAVIVAMAVYDIVRGYRKAIESTGHELDVQARTIAEQTARTIQAVDVVLRHLEQQFQQGPVPKLSGHDLHLYLREQLVGLVQIDGLTIRDARGISLATSWAYPVPAAVASVADRAFYQELRDSHRGGLYIGSAIQSRMEGEWVFPLARRLESESGEFAGFVAARGRIDYFQDFYRDIRLDAGTKVTLMLRNATMLARHPPTPEALGGHYPLFNEMMASRTAGRPGTTRAVSPVDGVERFGALAEVTEYPLVVLVTRDAAVALAPWRAQAMGSTARTAALALLAALLLAISLRQVSRLNAARESLEISQERFAVAVAGSDDGIFEWDYATGRAFGSQRAREILGLPPGPEMQSIEEWFAGIDRQIHPEDAPRRLAALEEHLAGRALAYESEFRVRNPDGSYRWLHIRGMCNRVGAGKPHRMAGSITDIDARKRAEEALRKSEERFALAVSGSNDGIIDWDVVNDRMYTSERAMRIMGVESAVTMRTREQWRNLVRYHPDDAQRMKDELQSFLEGHTELRDGEYRVLHPDGAYRWIRHRNRCVRDSNGNPVRVAGSVSDVDAQKRAEAALRASEERYQLVVDGANQGLWDWNLGTDVMFVSPRAQEFMGLEPGEPLGPRRDWIARSPYHPDDRQAVRAALSAHLRGETPYFAIEHRMMHPSGDWHWYRQRGVALRDVGGRPYRMAGSMEDITDYKAAETHRVRLEGQLLQAKKLEAIGTLAGGIAHDFNNILAAILGYGEMAQKQAVEGTALRRHLDAVVGAGLRAKSLVERILAFSRTGLGERAPVRVQSVVAEALDLVAASLPGHVRLDRQLAAGDAAVMGDPTQIHQVVMNLCANGAQAMKTAGTLTVSLDVVEKGQVIAATSALASGRYVRLSVRDTGAGIPANVLERVFDPFFTTKEVGVGTGLGLSLVHGIVTDLGGGIDVESPPGAGATFTVYLPWSDAVAAVESVEETVSSGAGETILLVDDEEALVRLGEEMIATLGYEPVGFTSSAAALAAFRAAPERFNAVLTDESMPDMTGSELAKELLALRPRIPVVLMSGFVTPALSARARSIGVTEVLPKPVAARDIARTLAAALRQGPQA
jgi:PAS domain S-box-containing protein